MRLISGMVEGCPREFITAFGSGDWDRDGDNDLVLVDSENGNVSLLRNSGDQSFAVANTLAVGGLPFGAALGNFDGDSLPDLAVSRLQFGHVALYRNLGNGQFQELNQNSQRLVLRSTPTATDFGAPATVISGDFNNDGKADLAATDVSGEFHRVFVWLNTSNLTFAAPQVLTLSGTPGGLVAADFNGDGALDLAATDFDCDRVSIWLNLNNGTGSLNSTARNVNVGDGPISLAAGNFDGVPGVDLVVANQLSGSVTMLTNDGVANLTSRGALAGTSSPSALVLADFDGRNGLDLAVTQGQGDSAQPLFVYFNSGDSTAPFVNSVAYGAADLGTIFNAVATSSGFALTAANLDGDQDPDLVVVNSGAQSVSTLRTGPGRAGQTVRLTANGASPTNINFGIAETYSASFDAGTGQFVVSLPLASEVEISGLAGFVLLRVNGVLDTELSVPTNAVQSVVVQGSAGADRIDLSGVSTTTGFTHAKGVSVRVEGHAGADSLIGSAFGDLLIGAADADVLIGNDGADTLQGGDGSDTLQGLAGDDDLSGGRGADQLDAGTGSSDRLRESGDASFTLSNSSLVATFVGQAAETDSLLGFEQALLTGGTSSNRLDAGAFTGALGVVLDAGGNGNDTLIGTNFRDTITGGIGRDSIVGNDGDDSINSGSGNDIIHAGNGRDSILAAAGADSILGGDGVDTIFGGTGNDTIDGGTGNDNINGQSDDDSVLGGDGHDRLMGDVGNDVLRGGIGDDTLKADAGLDSLIGEDGNDSLMGGDDADRLEGGAGNDTIRGDKQADTLFGGAGGDSLVGGADNDSLDGGDDNDTLNGDFGNDSLWGGAGADRLSGLAGDDSLDGGTETDFVTETGDTDVVVTGSNLTSLLFGTDTTTNVERIHLNGGAANNTFDARAATIIVRLFGNDGNDTLLGGSKVDSLVGGNGDDVLSGGASNDIMDGGAGTDFIYEVGNVDFTLNATQVISTATGTETLTNIERAAVVGGAGNNRIDASAASIPVILLGGSGHDTLLGGNFNDVLIGGSRTVTPATSGGDGTDSLVGGQGRDTYDNDPLDSRSVLETNEEALADAAVFATLPTWLDLL